MKKRGCQANGIVGNNIHINNIYTCFYLYDLFFNNKIAFCKHFKANFYFGFEINTTNVHMHDILVHSFLNINYNISQLDPITN